jgi:hypothetical protein
MTIEQVYDIGASHGTIVLVNRKKTNVKNRIYRMKKLIKRWMSIGMHISIHSEIRWSMQNIPIKSAVQFFCHCKMSKQKLKIYKITPQRFSITISASKPTT